MAPMELNLLTVQRAAELANVSPDLIWKAIREGDLATEDLGFQHQLVIRPEVFSAWLHSREVAGLTVGAVAAALGVSRPTITQAAKSGRLRGRKVVGKWVFQPADVVAFAEERGFDVDESELEPQAA
jgi:excisionase family DNA binding protein